MLALRNFILYGITWHGHADDVEFMQDRATRVILHSLADQTSARNPSAGLKKSRPGLSGYMYQKSTVSATLRKLKVLGIVKRERAGRKGGIHEEFATTTIVTELVNAAVVWQKQCQQLQKTGKREEEARPAKTVLQIPLKSTSPSAELSLAWLAEDQHPNTGLNSVQKLETVSVFTPPLAAEQRVGGDKPASDLGGKFRGVRGREPLPPAFLHINSRPYFTKRDILDFRKFSSWLFLVNKCDYLTSISLIQPSSRGRLLVLEKQTKSKGARSGLTSIDPARLFNFAFARSREVFERCGEGEQVFLAPRPGSRILLVDDLKTDRPVVDNTPVAILQTSFGNFQHFYVCDRELEADERNEMQKALALKFGGDAGATGGHQPHRCPGSVNYKPDRSLFVTRLIHHSIEGRPIPFCAGVTAHSAVVKERPTTPPPGATKGTLACTAGDQSAADWAWVKTNSHLGFDKLVSRLAASSAQRGKHADYARRTVEKALLLTPV